ERQQQYLEKKAAFDSLMTVAASGAEEPGLATARTAAQTASATAQQLEAEKAEAERSLQAARETQPPLTAEEIQEYEKVVKDVSELLTSQEKVVQVAVQEQDLWDRAAAGDEQLQSSIVRDRHGIRQLLTRANAELNRAKKTGNQQAQAAAEEKVGKPT